MPPKTQKSKKPQEKKVLKLTQESILDLSKYQDQSVWVQFQGGRKVIGTLKGYDPLQNLVLDDTIEILRSKSR